jgi:thiol-disulfide isomerase/thioredoxin
LEIRSKQLTAVQPERNTLMRGFTKGVIGLAAIVASIGAASAIAQAPTAAQPTANSLDGRWEARLTNNGLVIPFRLDISGDGATLKGTLYNGFQPYETTTSASFQDGKLVLNIEHYLTTINATLKDGELTGNVVSQSRDSSAQYQFEATLYVAPPPAPADVPSIAGSWEIPLDKPSAKGEKAFRFIVTQQGADVAASILRVDGDTGAYSGTYKDGKWVLSHFDGSRPGVIEVSLNQDGNLDIIQQSARPKLVAAAASTASSEANPYTVATADAKPGAGDVGGDSRYAPKLTAYRSEVARAKGLPEPDDYTTHTTARNPNEKFAFSFPDVNGKLVSNTDPQFKNKVIIAIVTGTWCPNCHDEAQYLVQLYKKYHDQGLEIVALDFEEPEQQGSLERERAFVKQYGVKYTYLIAGAPAEMWEKVPQLVNLNTWPATIFVGRDGLVKGTHSGFASPASGEFNAQLKAEFTQKIEQMLAEKNGGSLTASATDVPADPGRK